MPYSKSLKLISACCVLLGMSEATGAAERVTAFHSEINIHANHDVHVQDRLEVVALGDKVKRGILRTLYASKWILSDERQIEEMIETLSSGSIPKDFDVTDPPIGKAIKGFDSKLNLEFVTKNGEPEPYQMEAVQSASLSSLIVGEQIRVGEAATFLAPGNYTYEMSYRFKDNIVESDGRKYAKLQLTGFGWTLPLQRISGRIHLPPGSIVVSAFCHTSATLESNCDITWDDEVIDLRGLDKGYQAGLVATIVWMEPDAIS